MLQHPEKVLWSNALTEGATEGRIRLDVIQAYFVNVVMVSYLSWLVVCAHVNVPQDHTRFDGIHVLVSVTA